MIGMVMVHTMTQRLLEEHAEVRLFRVLARFKQMSDQQQEHTTHIVRAGFYGLQLNLYG